ncbi:hypothetical protein A6763_09205 [Aeromonas caviae]|nr:hypothetical protein A6763_09205 [Aeromonas caviae]
MLLPTTAAFAAIAHFLPAAGPLAPPGKRTLADGTDLLGKMGFEVHVAALLMPLVSLCLLNEAPYGRDHWESRKRQ